MNRTFQGRINPGQYLFLLLAAGVAIWALWHKLVLLGVLFLLLLVVAIERLIHTTYTITTDGKLVVYKGRFAHTMVIDLKEITEVSSASYLRWGQHSLVHAVAIHYGQRGFVSLMPQNEEEFLRVLYKRMNQLATNENEEEPET